VGRAGKVPSQKHNHKETRKGKFKKEVGGLHVDTKRLAGIETTIGQREGFRGWGSDHPLAGEGVGEAKEKKGEAKAERLKGWTGKEYLDRLGGSG